MLLKAEIRNLDPLTLILTEANLPVGRMARREDDDDGEDVDDDPTGVAVLCAEDGPCPCPCPCPCFALGLLSFTFNRLECRTMPSSVDAALTTDPERLLDRARRDGRVMVDGLLSLEAGKRWFFVFMGWDGGTGMN